MPTVSAVTSRRRSRLLSAAAGVTCLLLISAFFFFFFFPPFRAAGASLLSPGVGVDDARRRRSEYYEWRTHSAFHPVNIHHDGGGGAASPTDLCAAFPTHLLADVQPVLKTGHGVLERRVRPQMANGLSCLTNLLLFSDTEEHFHGLHLADVIADVPQRLIDSTEQLEPYRRLRRCATAREADCDAVLTGGEGWRIDKFKFLAGVSRAWQMRPGRRWYVFFEADTYIVWDTVFRLLANFDADVPLYFGSPAPGREGTWFAFGGAGFILSRAAMRKLTEDDWDRATGEWLGSVLTEREWDGMLHDCCGDSILGWALSRRGVRISGLWPMFNPHPPHGVPFSDLYWCQPVLGMHKPHEGDVEELWRWEWHQRPYERPLLYRDMATSFFNVSHLSRRTAWNNADWDGFRAPGPDEHHPVDPHQSPDDCATSCAQHPSCFQWTHHPDTCTFVRSIRMGSARYHQDDGSAPRRRDDSFVAGWDTDRIRRWIDGNVCEEVQWVKPSTERIF